MHDHITFTVPVCQSALDWETTINGYTVRFGLTPRGPYQYDWSCTCKGFRFRGTCKHIEQAKPQRCGWNQCLEPTTEATDTCPLCGSPTVLVNVAD